MEDGGSGVQFNVFCYNAQPGVVINYATGESWEDPGAVLDRNTPSTYSESGPETVETESLVVISEDTDYVLNTRSMRFHLPSCNAIQEMSERNRLECQGTREELIEEGYFPCGSCKP